MHYIFKMRVIIAFFPITLGLFFSSDTLASNDLTTSSYLTVIEIDGPILFWQPMSTTWEPLSVGHRIYGEALIQATKPAKIIVKKSSILGNEENLTLSMSGPTILRLRSKLNRQIVLSSFSMNTDKNNLPIGSGLVFKAAVAKSLPTAWERVKQVASLILNLSEEDMTLITPKEPSRAISINTHPSSIKIKVPADGTAYMVESFPTHIPVVWEHKQGTEPPKHVDILIENEMTKQVISTHRTAQNAVALSIDEAGVYKISISVLREVQENIESSSITVESPDHQIE